MYPYPMEPTFGLFVHDQVKELARRCEVMVVSFTPLSPPIVRGLKSKWGRYASKPHQDRLDGIDVQYPRYLNIPGARGFPLSVFLYSWAGNRFVAALKDKFGFDLVHAHAICPDGFAAAHISRQTGVPAVCTIHGSDVNIYPHRTRLTRLITQHAIGDVNAIITVSAALREKTLELATPRNEIQVISNGVDVKKFAPLAKEQQRAALGLPQDAKILLYVSRLDQAKGLSYLLMAVQSVLRDEGNCLLVLLGEGPYRARLDQECAELGLENNVRFAGWRPHDEVAQWMGACDLVVQPSLHEGSPLPVYEALACGRPMIASQVGGIPELIISEDYGLLVPPADVAALSKALLCGLHKEWNTEQIRAYGRQYSWEHVGSQLISLYERMLARPTEAYAMPASSHMRR
jgi:glycosyltransferase involved in cell wall biosynthesis